MGLGGGNQSQGKLFKEARNNIWQLSVFHFTSINAHQG